MLQRYKVSRVIWLFWLFSIFFHKAWAQNNVGIGTNQPNPNAVLQLVAPNANQGFLIPTLTTPQRTAGTFTGKLSTDDNGLMIFDLDEKVFYYWSDSTWIPLIGNVEAGGDLSGTYPAPVIREGVVATEKLADEAVTSDKIADKSIIEDDFRSPGPGKVLTTTGSGQVFWDNQSIFGLSFLEQGRVYVGNSGNKPEAVDLRGIGNILVGNGTTAAAVLVNGDLSLNSAGNAQITAGAVGTDEVQDNSLTNADINENAAIVGSKINPVFGIQNISTTGNLAVQDINANGNLSIAGKASSASTTATDIATTLTTKGYVEDYVDTELALASQNLEDGDGIVDFTYDGTVAATVTVNNGEGLDFESSGALQIADGGVTAIKINPDVAGDGLTQNTSGALDLDINDIAGTMASANDEDLLPVYDNSALQTSKIEWGDLIGNTLLNADNITSGTLGIDRLPDQGPGAQTFGGSGDVIESIEIDDKGRIVSITAGPSPSDIRLKKEIVPLQGALHQVLQMKAYHYYWKDQSRDTTLQIGVIAQELEKIYPELVMERSDHYKGVNYIGLIPVLIEAIKEQQDTIHSLQQRMAGIQQTATTSHLQQLEELRQENKSMRAELDMIKSALDLREEAKLPAVSQPE